MDARLATRGNEPDPDEAASGLSSEQLLDSLRRTRSWLVLFALVGIAGAGFLAVVTPNTYISVGKLMVRWGSREQTTTDSVDGPQRAAASSRVEDIQTEIQLLTAPVVFERTVHALGAGVILRSTDPTTKDDASTLAPIHWFHVAQKWWFDRSTEVVSVGCCTDHTCPRCVDAATRSLQSRIAITPEPGTSVIDIAAVANRPEDAKKLVEALLTQIAVRHREVFATDPAYEFLQRQMNEAKDARDAAQLKLADSRQLCHVYDIGAQRASLLKELDDLEGLARSQQTEQKSIGATLTLYARWIAAAKEKKPEKIQVELPNPAYDMQLKHIETLRSERELLLANHVPGSTEVAEKERQIAVANETLEATPLTKTVESTSSSAAQVARLQAESESLMAKQKGLEAATEATAAQRSSVDDALEKLANCEPDLKRQEKEVESKTAAANHFTEACDRYAVTKALDEANMSNLRPIQEATLPYEKSGPNRKAFVLLGLILGVGAGLALAFVRAAFDRRLRGARDVERQLGVPVIATMPEVASLRRLTHGPARRMIS